MLAILYAVGLIGCFYALAKICDEYFVKSLDIIAKKWKLSEDVAGATLMAIGTSAPEFFTAVIAVITISRSDVGAGTIVGSAIFNILVIIGGSAVLATAYLRWQPVIRDMLFYIFSIIILLFTFMDGKITLWETVIYIAAYILYIAIMAQWNKVVKSPIQTQLGDIAETIDEEETKVEARIIPVWSQFVRFVDMLFDFIYPDLNKKPNRYWAVFWISILLIIAFAWALVELAVGFAHELGLPEVIIALTILAGGTSIPDALSSFIVAKQGRGDMAVSNAVGSNIFDILLCLGLPWFVYIAVTGKTVAVATDNLLSSVFLLFCTVVAILFILIVKKFRIGKYAGYALILLYVLYVTYMILNSYYPDSFGLDEWLKVLIS